MRSSRPSSERIEYGEQGFVDHKTELQERLARQGASVSYRLMEATGPAHRRSFTTAAMLGDEIIGTGEGTVEEGLRAGCRPGGAAARGRARAGCASERHPRARLQVVPRAARAALRARRLGRGRPERLRQVQHRRRAAVGHGLAAAQPAARPDRPGRALRRLRAARRERRVRGRARARQQRRPRRRRRATSSR